MPVYAPLATHRCGSISLGAFSIFFFFSVHFFLSSFCLLSGLCVFGVVSVWLPVDYSRGYLWAPISMPEPRTYNITYGTTLLRNINISNKMHPRIYYLYVDGQKARTEFCHKFVQISYFLVLFIVLFVILVERLKEINCAISYYLFFILFFVVDVVFFTAGTFVSSQKELPRVKFLYVWTLWKHN